MNCLTAMASSVFAEVHSQAPFELADQQCDLTQAAGGVVTFKALVATLTLEQELAGLSAEHRAEAERQLALRARARTLAAAMGVDESDVYHQLLQLARTPSERLRLGLAHGRLRPRLIE